MEIDLNTTMNPKTKELIARLISAVKIPGKTGRKSTQLRSRNWLLDSAVRRLISMGYPEFGVQESACAIVAEQMCRLGHPLTDGAVYKAIQSLEMKPEDWMMVEIAQKELQKVIENFDLGGKKCR